MEAIIRTENKTLFEALLHFLKTLNISVETKEEKSPTLRNVAKGSHKINEKQNGFKVPGYKCEGKVSDFKREDLYDSRL